MSMDLDHGWLIRRNNWGAGLCFGVWFLTIGLWCLSFNLLGECLVKPDKGMLSAFVVMLVLHLLLFIPVSVAIHVQVSSLYNLILKNTDNLALIGDIINNCIDQLSTIDIQANNDEFAEVT